MSNSLTQSSQLTCPFCQQMFSSEILLILDASERPDLIEGVCDGTVNESTCPNCKEPLNIQSPLLIYKPGSTSPLLFTPLPNFGKDENQRILDRLIDHLKKKLASNWEDAWRGRIVEASPSELKQLINTNSSPPPNKDESQLIRIIQSFTNAGSLEMSRIILENNPILLQGQSLLWFGLAVSFFAKEGNEDARQFFAYYRTLLLRCKEMGIQEAFNELAHSETNTNEHLRQIMGELSHHPDEKNYGHRVQISLQALEYTSKYFHPLRWANLNHEIALYLVKDRSNYSPKIIEEAINYYNLSLTIYSKETYPEQWAGANANLARVYLFHKRDTTPEDIESAINHFKKSLEVYTCESFPLDWAMAQRDLARAYLRSKMGDRDNNIEMALQCFLMTLDVFSEEAYPQEWSETHIYLGQLYADRILDNRADNLDCAIHHLELALQVVSYQVFPNEWIGVLNDLGNIYKDRLRGNRADNLEEAIRYYNRALEVVNPETDADRWAGITLNLAIVMQQRLCDDRADNLEQTIELCKKSLSVLLRQSNQEHWALVHNALGAAYQQRICGEKGENLEESIRCFQNALEVFTRQKYPSDWAMVNLNLANSYLYRVQGERLKNLELAIDNCGKALYVYTRQAFPDQWATIQNTLGNMYRNRLLGDRKDNLETAVSHYQQAFNVYSPQDMAVDWAMVQFNLAFAYSNLLDFDQPKYLQMAIDCYENALQVYTSDDFPLMCQRTAVALGNLELRRGNWFSAYQAFSLARHASEAVYQTSFLSDTKQASVHENIGLYDGVLSACIHLHNDASFRQEALVYTEKGKSRAFLDSISKLDFPIPQGVPFDLRVQEVNLISKLRNLDTALMSTNSPNNPIREIERARNSYQKELNLLWENLGLNYPHAAEYVSFRRGETPSWQEITQLMRHLDDQSAIISFYLLPQEILALVIRKDWEAPGIYRIPLPQQELVKRYMSSYWEEMLAHVGLPRKYTWLSLGEILLSPLSESLGGIKLVYLIPHGWLHTLPLHALSIQGVPFIQNYAVVYVPSLGILSRIIERRSNKSNIESALVLGYTKKYSERKFFVNEACSVANYFRGKALIDDEANEKNLESFSLDASLIHISSHGDFTFDDPMRSPIYLSSGPYAAHRWMNLILKAELVTLSACRTGFSDVKAGDELLGMQRAIFYAGARSTLATLWPVYAETTEKWMLDFYRYGWDNFGNKLLAKAFAFQAATLALRSKFSEPYYWAPFILSGDGF